MRIPKKWLNPRVLSIVAVIVIGLPLTVLLALSQRDTRQRASTQTTTQPMANVTCGTPYWSCVGGLQNWCAATDESTFAPPSCTAGQITSQTVCTKGGYPCSLNQWYCYTAQCTCKVDSCPPKSCGETCTSNSECQSNTCSGGVCYCPPDPPTNTPISTNTPKPPTPTIVIEPTATPIPSYALSGIVFIDTNRNGIMDTGEIGYSGATINVAGTSTNSTQSNSSGSYTLTLQSGSYTVTLTVPAGHQATTTNPVSVSLTGARTVNFGIAPIPTSTPIPTATPTNTPIPTATPTIIPTNTPLPTPTPTPQPIILVYNLFLHGLGNSGDNANAAFSLSNKNPLHPVRNAVFSLYDSNNVLVSSQSGTLTYASASGSFQGSINIGVVPNGNYIVKVKSDQYLRNSFAGIQILQQGTTKVLPDLSMVTGDIIDDNKLNILDYNQIYGCYQTPLFPVARDCTPARKAAADINDEGEVNQYDYNLFLRELSVQFGQ